MSWKSVPLLHRNFAGNDCCIKDRESCWKAYETLFTETAYVHLQNARTAPDSETYVRQLLKEAPRVRRKGKLAVVTGVTLEGVGYYIARELAVQAGFHVILLGKSERNLEKCIQSIQEYAITKYRLEKDEVVLYKHKFYLASLDSVEKAAHFCTQIAEEQQYQGTLATLINQANVGSAQAKLTQQNIEYNTGCNFVATHYFITSLLPLLQKAASENYKPRVSSVASIGHALGSRFQPHRLVQHPKEGGAPAGYIIVQPDGSIREYDPKEEEDGDENNNNSTLEESMLSLSFLATRLAKYLPTSTPTSTPEHMAKVGTQVGRSKMALVADTIHMAERYPEISFSSYHAGATTNTTPVVQHYLGNYYSCSQAARAALRAALDPHMDTEHDLMGGVYLHADGNPWTPMEPSVKNPVSGELYCMSEYALACHDAVEELLNKIWRQRREKEDDTCASLGTSVSVLSKDRGETRKQCIKVDASI